ncbi:MAG TPA: hypothetical protein DD679_02360, partial [Pantoea agglomerans]|nr:hypothetical protein [Pantoea agglomerans]
MHFLTGCLVFIAMQQNNQVKMGGRQGRKPIRRSGQQRPWPVAGRAQGRTSYLIGKIDLFQRHFNAAQFG